MLPLIRLEDNKYCGIDPDGLKLPPPTPPSDRLISAVEAFYAPPSHERPRDNEGWEKLGLYEYFKMKNSIRKQRDEEIMRGERERSRSPSPIPPMLTKPARKIKKRVYRSKSPEDKRSKSRSASPEQPKIIVAALPVTKSKFKKKSRSPSPQFRGFNREPRERVRKRSISPPSFAPSVASNNKTVEFLDEGNKGHQMLKKLGWQSGGGLGAGNQGIVQPISAGEVRDRTELYKVRNFI
jgi:calcium homeostasis ER protein